MIRAVLMATIFAIVGGCASHSHEIATADVSPTGYMGLECNELHAEITNNINKVHELGARLDKLADDDEAQTAVGLILFWPVLFALEGGDDVEAAEYSRLKGEIHAMENVAIRRDCKQAMIAAEDYRNQEIKARELRELKKQQQQASESYY